VLGISQPTLKLRRMKRHLVPLILLSPALALVGFVIAHPIVSAIRLSFQNFNVLRPARTTFAGWQNYIDVLQNPVFWTALQNSLVWVLGAVSLQLIFGFIGALLLNQSFLGRGVIRGVLLIPWATPSVLVALMWMWMLDGNYGVINDLLKRLGIIEFYVPWLAQSNTALPTLIVVDVWQGIPFFAVMILAALQSVPGDIKEAALIDGASTWQSLWLVIVPFILPAIMITVVLRIIWTANYMDLMFVMTNGGPGYATTTLPFLSYVTAYRQLNFGQGATIAIAQAILLAGVILIYLRLLRRQGAL
jgi:multiple sugar transport system permease protein